MCIMRGAIFRLIPLVFGAVCLAIIAHIASIMLMPHVSVRNPALVLSKAFPVNQLELIDPDKPSPFTLPFADPAMRTAVCAYDVSEKPVRVTIETGGSFLSVVFMQPDGKIFYSVTDKSAIQRKLDLVVATAEQIVSLETQDPDDEAVQEWRLRTPESKGIVIIRALVSRVRESADVQALLGRTECYQE
jgi:uncharacterized membrane protein